jgi:hypothetical protein
MLSPDTQLGGQIHTPLSGALLERPETEDYGGDGMFSAPSQAQAKQYSDDCAKYYSARQSWSDHTQPGGKTFDFSDDGNDRMAECTAAVPSRDDAEEV